MSLSTFRFGLSLFTGLKHCHKVETEVSLKTFGYWVGKDHPSWKDYLNSNDPFISFVSYLAGQCWNGGCIYLIMLRRVKRKAPLPPCDISTIVSSDSCEDQRQSRAASEASDTSGNSRRTRKFGVISRSSSNRDNRNSSDSEQQSCYNGYNSSSATDALANHSGEDSGCISSTHTPTEDRPHTFPQVRTLPQRLYRGSAATLPARCYSQLLECQMESFSSEPSSQV